MLTKPATHETRNEPGEREIKLPENETTTQGMKNALSTTLSQLSQKM